MPDVTIDATNKILGRLATEVAKLLMGKTSASFEYRRPGDVKVVVTHTDGIRVTGKKAAQKLYRHHSGFHGGLKETSYQALFERDSRRVLLHAVKGMLPKNKLQAPRLKRLIMYRGEEK